MLKIDPHDTEQYTLQSNHCGKDSFVIKSPGDLKSIESCNGIAGDIIISNYNYPIITLDDLDHINGSLIIKESPELVRFEAANLKAVDAFTMKDLTSLSYVSLPSLQSIKVIDWKVLPIFNNVQLSKDIHGISQITISDTSLTVLGGLLADRLIKLDVNNNRFLEEIVLGVNEIGILHVSGNSADLRLSLSDLKKAGNASIHDVLAINLDQLESIDGTASFVNNQFNSLNLPKLKSVGGTFNLLKNERLNKVSIPSLQEIGGGLMLIKNSFEKIDFFPKLVTIGGAIELVGPIKEATLQLLKLVKGSVKIVSSSKQLDCSKWSKLSLVRGGKSVCTNGDTPSTESKSNFAAILEQTSGSNSINISWVMYTCVFWFIYMTAL